MNRPIRTATRLACIAAACATSLCAQDSISKVHAPTGGGDAVSVHATGEQVNDFVVDLSIQHASWNHVFGIAPLVKASQQRNSVPDFYSASLSAQAHSGDTLSNAAFLRPSYSVWNAPGFGVNDDPLRNDVPATVNTTGFTGLQFGVGFAEFSTGTTAPAGGPAGINNIIAAVVNQRASRPSRLYVSRIAAATNGSAEDCDAAQFGFGQVDASGNVHFRGDGSGAQACSSYSTLIGNNLFRVASLARNPTLVNVLSNVGGTDATSWLLTNSTTTHNTPTGIPASVAGRPVLIGSNFGVAPAPGFCVYEQTAGTLASTTAHLGAGVTDHRGNAHWSPHNFAGLLGASTHGTLGIVGRSTSTNVLNVWGVDANGNPTGALGVQAPAVITDNHDSWASTTLAPGAPFFVNIASQVAFRGGNGQVAIGRDVNGDMLLAATCDHGPAPVTPNQNQNNLIAVAKVEDVTGQMSWTIAAYTANSSGKTIWGGAGGSTAIGRLVGMSALPPPPPPGTQNPPSMSSPMIDAAGNVWFLCSMEIFGTPSSTFTRGLVRAVYNPSAFNYKLELVLREGDVVHGQNSNTNYQVRSFEIQDNNSIGSGTTYSGNISPKGYLNQSVSALPSGDERSLGGLVVAATIVYDQNGDGQYVRATGPAGTPGSPDEDYQVLLYLTAAVDCNLNGVPDDADIANGTATDTNNNGIPDSCEGITGTPFCFGDGTGVPCPCANHAPPGSGAGCLHSFGIGALLGATGTPSLANDTLVLQGSNMPNSSALYFQGTIQQAGGAGIAFGDGKRCAGGTVTRLSITTNVGGASQYPFGTAPAVSVKGMVTAPGTRTYQVWYRNAAGFCTPATFNLTNGLQILWTP